MAIINYDDNPSGFKNAWLNENNPKGILIKFPKYYKKVIPSSNPYSEGLYEHNDRKKKYVFTTDTTIVDNKRYFQLIEDENNILKYTDEDIEDDSFSLKKNIQNGDNIDFIGCISSTLEFKVANDFLYLIDQEINVTLITIEGDTEWHIKVFTGYVDEIKRDKSRDLVRTITCHDFMYRLLDNYDVTDWYVWQYGDGDFEGSDTLKHSIYDLRNSFWNYIANSGTEWSPNGTRIEKRNEGWDQVQDANLINDNIWIPKTLNVSPVEYDEYVSGELVGGPFKKVVDFVYEIIPKYEDGDNPKANGWYEYNDDTKDYFLSETTYAYWNAIPRVTYYKRIPKSEIDPGSHIGTQYIIYEIPNGIIQGWDVTNIVARKQIIDLGINTGGTGTLFTYTYNGVEVKDTHFRKYLGDCTTLGTGIQATIKIPAETIDKVRETQITAATVLQAFCQFNGIFGQVNGNGKFEYIKLNTSDPFEILEDYQIDIKHSDNEMPKITGVVIFDKTSEEYSNDQIHTDYGDVKNGKKGSALAYYPEDSSLVEGDDAKPFIMDNNFLMNSFVQSDAINVAKNLYDNIHELTMMDSDIEISSMPWLMCGESIYYYVPSEDTLYPSDDLYPSGYKKILSVVMDHEITGTGLLKSKITCKVENLSSGSIVSLNEVISAEMFSRQIGDSKQFSRITQTKDEIDLLVQKTEREYSEIKQTSDRIELRVVDLDAQTSGIQTEIIMTKNEVAIHAETISLLSRDLKIVSDTVNIQAQTIDVMADDVNFLTTNGVTFTDLSDPNSRTVINGGHITTGTINCSRIGFGRVTVDGETHEVNWRKLEHIIQGYPQGAFQYMQSAAIFKTSVINNLGTSITYVGPNGDPQTIKVLTPDDLIGASETTTPYGGCIVSINAPSNPQVLIGAKMIKTGAILMAEVEEEV